MLKKQKILFAPVSSDQGIGEYMRSLILAQGLLRKWPQLDIQFIVNRHAPYVDKVPFRTHLLDHSPTKEIAAVNAIVTQQRPDLIVFDCSGRAAQYRHAASMGAKVVFISQHKRKRSRGFSLRRLPYIDQHWIAQLQFVDGDLTVYERYMQKLFGKQQPLFIGPVFDDCELDNRPAQAPAGNYIVYSSGGGGYKIKQRKAVDVFARAAAEVYNATGITGVVISGANYTGTPVQYEGVNYIEQMANAEFMSLLNHAGIVVISGGDLMSQAMVMHLAVIAVPVASDQAGRIRSFEDEKLVFGAAADERSICEVVCSLSSNNQDLEMLRERVAAADIHNGLDVAINAIDELLS